MGFLDRKSLVFLAIIVALSVALIAVCIDAYAGSSEENTGPQKDTTEELKCEKASVTTASGSLVHQKAFCSGDLIFEDNFDRLDLERWQHEHTLGGGGVS